jgi:hypothetical protein
LKGKVFTSHGVHVANVRGNAIFDLTGNQLYCLKGMKSTGFPENWFST